MGRSFFFRRGAHRNDDESHSCGEEEAPPPPLTKAETKHKLLDLEALIGMCVVKIQLPPSEDTVDEKGGQDDEETGLLSGVKGRHRSVRPTRGLRKGLGVLSKGARRVGSKAATRAVDSATLLIPSRLGRDKKSSNDTKLVKPQNRCVASCFWPLAYLCQPISIAVGHFWPNLLFRVWLVPVALLLVWMLLVTLISALFRYLPLPQEFLLPYLALSLTIVAVVVQAWIVAMPIAIGIATLLSQLQSIIDVAFDNMVEVVPRKVTSLLVLLKIPNAVAENLGKLLFRPFREVLGTIYSIIPRVDDLVPPWAKEAKPLQPILFAGLLVALFFGQVLLVLNVGTMMDESVEIALGMALCALLGFLALRAGDLIPILVSVVETLLNILIQSLLRKLLPIAKLQQIIDTAQGFIPQTGRPRKRRKGAAMDEQSIATIS
jgi:hypothetical protein